MTEQTGCWTVPPGAGRVRLDQFLRSLLPGQSRSQIQIWIRKGLVCVNDRQVKTGQILKQGDQITMQPRAAVPEGPFPENIAIDVIYEDSDLAVIDKPAGMVCHTGAGVRSATLVNALLFHLGPLDSGDPSRPGIVHRLDKLTSGLLVVAKNNHAHRHLSQQFKDRQVKKEYLALVHGRPMPGSGTIDLALGRDPKNRKKISTRARRQRAAITHYQVVKEYKSLALLLIQLETGRTHQIRVHLAQRGHPVVGDTLYGGKRSDSLAPLFRQCRLQRFFLHACRLEFRHPRTGEVVEFTSKLPKGLQDLLSLLEGTESPAASDKRSTRKSWN